MLENDERIRLKKFYEEELSDEALVDLTQYPSKEYKEGVYLLMSAAIKKRGLEENLAVFKQNLIKEPVNHNFDKMAHNESEKSNNEPS